MPPKMTKSAEKHPNQKMNQRHAHSPAVSEASEPDIQPLPINSCSRLIKKIGGYFGIGVRTQRPKKRKNLKL